MEHNGPLGFLLVFFDQGASAARDWLRRKREESEYVHLEDEVFAGREKEYGGYRLRRDYPWHLLTALALTVVGMSWIVLLQRMTIDNSPPTMAAVTAHAIRNQGPPPGYFPKAQSWSPTEVEQMAYPINYSAVRMHFRQSQPCQFWAGETKGVALIQVGVDGRAQACRLLKGPRGPLSRFTYAFLYELQFQPALIHGAPVESWVYMPFSF